MGLLMLAAAALPGRIRAVTVDHGLRPENAEAHYELGQALKEGNWRKKAADSFRRSVELEPGNMEYREALAQVYRFGLQDGESAGAVYEPLLQGDLSPIEEAELRARQAYYQGPHEDVIKHVDKFNELGGESFETYFWRGRSHRFLENTEQADVDLQAAMKLAVTDQDFRDIAFQYNKMGNEQRALAAWNKAEELNPNSFNFYKARGEANWNLGKYDEAIADFDRFVELVPDQEKYSYLYKHLARLNYTRGNYEESLRCLERAIMLNPRDPSAVGWIGRNYRPERFDPPEFVSAFTTETVRPGPFVSLMCVAKGDPTPRVQWFVYGNEVKGDGALQTGSYTTSAGLVVSHLNITQARTKYGGTYECRASSKVGRIQACIYMMNRISVIFIPIIFEIHIITSTKMKEMLYLENIF